MAEVFTGIVETVGAIADVVETDSGIRIAISSDCIGEPRLKIGDSVAVSGVCLTAVSVFRHEFAADVSNETLNCTRIGSYGRGARVNLELPLSLDQPLGGHLVSGHVDGLARCAESSVLGDCRVLAFEVSEDLGKYIAKKGSVAIDGVSLTVNEVEDIDELTRFSVNLIPHTLSATTFSALSVGDFAHVEVDLMARYAERSAHQAMRNLKK